MRRALKVFRWLGFFAVNLMLMEVLTNLIETPFVHSFAHLYERTPASILRADALTSITAFGLGYFAYRRWRPASALWIWLAGAIFFLQRALIWKFTDPMAKQHSIYWEMSGGGGVAYIDSVWDWVTYTVPSLRTIAYSLGAYCCARVGRFGRSVPSEVLHQAEGAFVERYLPEQSSPAGNDSK